MNTTQFGPPNLVARVAVNVRLYFDVAVASTDEATILAAARTELERVAVEERIRVKSLAYPVLYPADVWTLLKPTNFSICEVTFATEANNETRFPL